ncbi:unnamed protein product [Nesidiocoris tenuis]|uniref:Cytochrome P450 n=1 Tax=Nesidiocoris tenuis TaxID=355587 RepID=A0A6H5HNS5_9HEMI|nr:unnamed protein product [Nesidiocoris tenuis]
MVRNPEFVQRIYTTDFSYFMDRGFDIDEKTNPLDAHIFLLSGAKWRYVRSKLSPIFTSGKLKWMFSGMNKCVQSLTSHLDKTISFGKDVDMKEDASGLTTEVISSCAFGIEAQSIGNPDGRFRVFAKKAIEGNLIKNFVRNVSPRLFTLLKMRSLPIEVEKFIMDLVAQSFNHRLTTGYTRNDFIQLLLQLREKGSVEFEDLDEEDEREKNSLTHHEQDKNVIELNDNILGAQLFVFLVAGYETTASTIYHLFYLFSKYPKCQDKAREEVKKALAKHGDYTYQMVSELPYLSNCIDETLRLFPPLVINFRVCNKDYTFPDGTTIEKGTKIVLPTYAIHHDPSNFPNPEEFRPERFEQSIAKGSYAPFGDGPRVCIGKRFALVEIKLTFARLLMSYLIKPSDRGNEVKFNPKSFLLQVKDGLLVKLEKL